MKIFWLEYEDKSDKITRIYVIAILKFWEFEKKQLRINPQKIHSNWLDYEENLEKFTPLYTMAINMRFFISLFLHCGRLILNHRGYMKPVFYILFFFLPYGRRALKVLGRRKDIQSLKSQWRDQDPLLQKPRVLFHTDGAPKKTIFK